MKPHFSNMDTTKDYHWLNEDSRKFLEKGYVPAGMTPEQRFRQIADNAERILGIEGFADKFEGYLKKGFYSLSSPVISNFGNRKGLPVSCFGSFIDDDVESILEKNSEVGKMTKVGGGTSAYFGAIRARGTPISVGGQADGPVRFMELFDTTASVISQGNTRRGAFAAYLPVEHPDILEFLQIRSEGHAIQELNIGVTITDAWMESMLAGDKDKRKVWGKIVQKRFESGYPYLFFTDTINKAAPKAYREKDIKIWASNLCSEICLSASPTESFVCVLSSINLLHWDAIKETDAVETLTYFLDAVTEEFILKSNGVKFLEAPNLFAKKQRAIGLGVLGWHSFLQSKSIAFESMEAKLLNSQVFRELDKRTLKASQQLAVKFGEPEVLKGYGERMTTRMAIAPTTSSSFILGQVSQGIEPLNSNYFVKDLAKGVFPYKNPFLEEVLEKYGKNKREVWSEILVHGGSVQKLEFLTEHEKNVFKTFGEISQKEIVIQAATRQKYIDQSQSLNLMIPPDVSAKDVSTLLIEGWKMGVKTFYYQRSANPAQELARKILTCASCEA
jgi:ribonucleoside-diphosphate reductase alpha chain